MKLVLGVGSSVIGLQSSVIGLRANETKHTSMERPLLPSAVKIRLFRYFEDPGDENGVQTVKPKQRSPNSQTAQRLAV